MDTGSLSLMNDPLLSVKTELLVAIVFYVSESSPRWLDYKWTLSMNSRKQVDPGKNLGLLSRRGKMEL